MRDTYKGQYSTVHKKKKEGPKSSFFGNLWICSFFAKKEPKKLQPFVREWGVRLPIYLQGVFLIDQAVGQPVQSALPQGFGVVCQGRIQGEVAVV